MRGIQPPVVVGVGLVALGALWLLHNLGVLPTVPVGPVLLLTIGGAIVVAALRDEPRPPVWTPPDAATPTGAGPEPERAGAPQGAEPFTGEVPSEPVPAPADGSPPTGTDDAETPGGWGAGTPGAGAAAGASATGASATGASATGASATGTTASATATVAPLTIARDGAPRARVLLNHGAGTLRITRGAPTGALLEVRGDGTAQARSARVGDRLDVTISPRGEVGGVLSRMAAVTWDIALAEDVPFELDLRTGAARVEADLRGLTVEVLGVKTGASEIELTLPDRGRCTTTVTAGAADVRVRVPDGVAALIVNRSALAGVDVDEQRFPRAGAFHRSPGYDEAAVRADITLEGGVASFTVR
jgi:hypothetical protein